MTRVTGFLVLGSLLLAAGCTPDPYAEFELGPARAVVAGSIDAIGGLARWRSVRRVNATAVMTAYDENGRAMVNEQRQVLNLRRGTIKATARHRETEWTAAVNARGRQTFRTRGAAIPTEDQTRLLSALETLIHRLRGPLNLCGHDEMAGRPERVTVDGEDLVRVPVMGGRGGIAAYYFDRRTYLLRMATAGADAPGKEGTVTIYTYRMMSNGMAFPWRIAVFKIGQHVLVGDRPVMQVDYKEVDF